MERHAERCQSKGEGLLHVTKGRGATAVGGALVIATTRGNCFPITLT